MCIGKIIIAHWLDIRMPRGFFTFTILRAYAYQANNVLLLATPRNVVVIPGQAMKQQVLGKFLCYSMKHKPIPTSICLFSTLQMPKDTGKMNLTLLQLFQQACEVVNCPEYTKRHGQYLHNVYYWCHTQYTQRVLYFSTFHVCRRYSPFIMFKLHLKYVLSQCLLLLTDTMSKLSG